MSHNPNPCFKLTVRMQRDSPSIKWGFRMQGGSDCNNIPLSVQSVAPGSLAEEVGLQTNDIITAIGDPPNPAVNWSHAEAEQVIRQCMDYLVLTIQSSFPDLTFQLLVRHISSDGRLKSYENGGSVKLWEVGRSAGADVPQSGNFALNQRNAAATNISSALPGASKWGGPQQPSYGYPGQQQPDSTYVQHSLAAGNKDWQYAGTGHNQTAKPFGSGGSYGGGPQNSLAGTISPGPQIVHNPYNSPMGLYSNQNATDAYSAQSTALLGSNQAAKTTKKPLSPDEPSPTMKAVQQVEQYGDFAGSFGQSASNSGYGGYGNGGSPSYGRQTSGTSSPAGGYRPVSAPQTLSQDHYQQPTQQIPKCSKCQEGIVGVFVRVRGQPMCVGCYKCCRCYVPLKTIGHFIVDDQLYCEQHAKMATRPGYGGYESRTVYS